MACDAGLKSVLTRHFCELMALATNSAEGCQEDPELVDRFFSSLNEPVGKTAKYAKAVNRILKGEHPTLFFALEYHDAESLGASDSFRECIPSLPASSGDPRRARTWQTLRVMARLCYTIKSVEPPRVPDRDEIEANIRQFRAARRAKAAGGGAAGGGASSQGSMQKAFYEKLIEVSQILPGAVGAACRERLHAIPVQEHADLCVRWSEDPYVSRNAPFGGSTFTRDERAAYTELDGAKWAQAEAAFRALNDLSSVHRHIPSEMLGTIENYASALAGKITSGETDLANIDLQSIGEDVLRQCSEDDMSQLANSMHQLLPALGSLQQTMQQQAGAHGQHIPDLASLASQLKS